MPEKYISLVQDMCRGCKTVVCSAAGESNSFGVEVGLHQGSALSPYLFLLLFPNGCVDRICEKGRTWINDVRR